jgi:two-component sensor histidine kinase
LRRERQPDGDILLVVGDDGVGYLSRDQSIHGSEASLGTQIIRGLVMQMGGLMTTRHDDGVRVEIRLPAPVTH